MTAKGAPPEIDTIVFDDPEPPAGTVTPYSFSGHSVHPSARLSGLERMGERLARSLRTLVEPYAGVKVQVTSEPLETLRFEAWRDALPPFTSLSLYRALPLKGGVLIALQPDLIARLVDSFYGGAGGASRPRKGVEFTPSEDRLVGQLADKVIEQIVEVWAEVAPLSSALVGRETNASYANLVRGDEPVVTQRFLIGIGNAAPARVSIVYPLAALRPFEVQLAAKVQDDQGPADLEWHARMALALNQVRLPVRSVLARPELTVAQLLQLKPGDVIPITLTPKAPLLVGNRRLATGTVGERDGRAALMIEAIEGDSGE